MRAVDPTPIEEPTETSPLLGEHNDRGRVNGDTEAGQTNGRPSGDSDRPSAAQKMHLLLPAVGVGVSLK